MQRYKTRVSLTKPYQDSEVKRLETRLTTLQIRKNKQEDLDEDDQNNCPSINPAFLKQQYTKMARSSILANITNAKIKEDITNKEEIESNKQIEKTTKFSYRGLVSPYADKDSFRKFITMLFKGTVYSVKFLKGPSEKYLSTKTVQLMEPKQTKKKFLVLDLDQTLIHSVPIKQKADVVLRLEDLDTISFNVRPYCYEFLQRMSEIFAIYVFTASTPAYANPIVQYLNKKQKTIHGVLARPHCMETKNGFYIKDLRIIKNRSLKDIIMVDNLVHSFGLQIENGIPILEFLDNPNDQQLRYLQKSLLEIKDVEDVRPHLQKKYRLKKIADMNQKQLLQ